METQHIYERIMQNKYYNEMKHLRNQWQSSSDSVMLGVESLIDIEGNDYRQYEFIVKRSKEIIFEMLTDIIEELLEEYKIPVLYYDLRKADTTAYYVSDKKGWIDYWGSPEEKRVLAFSRKDKHQDTLFIFKEFGFNNRLPEKTREELMKAAHLTRYCYISFVEEGAYREVINHNKDENDPTRGTGVFSFKQFMEGFFGESEYNVFKKNAEAFTKKVKDYYGIALVRTLKPNTIYNFRKIVRDEILRLDFNAIGAEKRVSKLQRQIIDKHFFDDKNYEVLLGNGDFAQSYLTAEWLFSSLSNAGSIDLTAIAMGYFKALEQLLFSFLRLHTKEKDGKNRDVYVGKGKTNANSWGYTTLTDSFINNPDQTKDLTLSSLTGFFGHYHKASNTYRYRNNDLLARGIDTKTHEFIIDTLDGIVGLRNGYFHKDNLLEWKKVIDARKTAHLVFYLVLGAYNFSEAEKEQLGMIAVGEHDDFYKLCEYINKKVFKGSGYLRFPIFYIDNNDNQNDFYYPYQDDYIEFDTFGEPIYSGVYFRKPHEKNVYSAKYTKDSPPNVIWEDTLIISESIPIKFSTAGIMKKVFCKGKFIADK